MASEPYQPPADLYATEEVPAASTTLQLDASVESTPQPAGLDAGAPVGYLPPALDASGEEIPPPPEEDDGLLEPTIGGGEVPAEPPAIPGSEDPLAGLFGDTSEEAAPEAPGEVAPEELQISCHNCQEIMEVTVTERPVTIQCWNCGAEGLIE